MLPIPPITISVMSIVPWLGDMKATIEVTITRKFRVEIRNQNDAERYRKAFHKHYEEDLTYGDRPLYADGEMVEPETKVESATTFVDLNW